jgi:hypothetical protein
MSIQLQCFTPQQSMVKFGRKPTEQELQEIKTHVAEKLGQEYADQVTLENSTFASGNLFQIAADAAQDTVKAQENPNYRGFSFRLDKYTSLQDFMMGVMSTQFGNAMLNEFRERLNVKSFTNVLEDEKAVLTFVDNTNMPDTETAQKIAAQFQQEAQGQLEELDPEQKKIALKAGEMTKNLFESAKQGTLDEEATKLLLTPDDSDTVN